MSSKGCEKMLTVAMGIINGEVGKEGNLYVNIPIVKGGGGGSSGKRMKGGTQTEEEKKEGGVVCTSFPANKVYELKDILIGYLERIRLKTKDNVNYYYNDFDEKARALAGYLYVLGVISLNEPELLNYAQRNFDLHPRNILEKEPHLSSANSSHTNRTITAAFKEPTHFKYIVNLDSMNGQYARVYDLSAFSYKNLDEEIEGYVGFAFNDNKLYLSIDSTYIEFDYGAKEENVETFYRVFYEEGDKIVSVTPLNVKNIIGKKIALVDMTQISKDLDRKLNVRFDDPANRVSPEAEEQAAVVLSNEIGTLNNLALLYRVHKTMKHAPNANGGRLGSKKVTRPVREKFEIPRNLKVDMCVEWMISRYKKKELCAFLKLKENCSLSKEKLVERLLFNA